MSVKEAAEKKSDVRLRFLQDCLDNQTNVRIFLRNGVQMSGIIAEFDERAVVFRAEGAEQLVCMSAISTVKPEQSYQRQHWTNATYGARRRNEPGFFR